jgi:multiple sugar transport system permease protein
VAVRRGTGERMVAGVVALGFAVFAMFPLVWTLLTSLKQEPDIIASGVRLLPHPVTLQNYVSIWTQSGLPGLMWNSAVTTGLTMVICVVAGTLASYSLSRTRFRGRSGLLLFFLVLRMFPVVLMVVPLFVILRGAGLLDTSIGLALAYSGFLLPIFIWMMKGFFDAIPLELEEAARMDGCTRMGAMLRVVLPLVKGGLGACTVFVGIAAWNEYLFALMLTTSGGSRTWPVGLQLMVGEFQLPWGALSAGGILSVVPVLVLFAFVQRSMVRGLAAGAVKG